MELGRAQNKVHYAIDFKNHGLAALIFSLLYIGDQIGHVVDKLSAS